MDPERGEVYFKGIPDLGDLFFYSTLFRFEVDEMIFICEDNEGTLYYCICDEYLHGKFSWLVVPVTKEIINDIISNKITILTPFKEAERVLIINCKGFETDYEEWESYWARYSDIDPKELPYGDYYLELEITNLLS